MEVAVAKPFSPHRVYLGAFQRLGLNQFGTDPLHLSSSLPLTHPHLNLSSAAAGIEPKLSRCPTLISGRTAGARVGANSILVTTQIRRALRRGGVTSWHFTCFPLHALRLCSSGNKTVGRGPTPPGSSQLLAESLVALWQSALR